MDECWSRLYDAARAVLNPRKIFEWMEAGGVAAAVEKGNASLRGLSGADGPADAKGLPRH